MTLKTLLVVHALITLAAAVVLATAPSLIPETVGMQLTPHQYLLCYFLAGGELAVAFLSFFGAKLTDPNALQVVVSTVLVFHGSTLLLEVLAYGQGLVGTKIFANVIFRVLIIALLLYYNNRNRLSKRQAKGS